MPQPNPGAPPAFLGEQGEPAVPPQPSDGPAQSSPTAQPPVKPQAPAEPDAVSQADLSRSRAARDAARQRQMAPEDAEGSEVIEAIADGKTVTPEQQQDALEWFLSDEEEEASRTFKLRIGGGPVDEDGNPEDPGNPPRFVDWTVKPIDLDAIKRIRRQAQGTGNRRQRRSGAGEIDDTMFNLGIVVEATISPDLVAAAQAKNIADPRQAVKMRFASRSGLIGQIVNEVFDFSGYNPDDVQEMPGGETRQVQAAGNS